MSRTCIKCQTEKEDTQFQYGKSVRNTCRDCHNNWRREAAKKYKEKSTTVKKTCGACKTEKDGSEFAYSLNICKKCKSEKDKESNNRPTEVSPPKTCTKCNLEQEAQQFRHQSKVCLTCEKERLYEWRKNNPDKFNQVCKRYREKKENKEKRATYLRDKYNTDMNFRLEHLFRTRARLFIKGGVKRGKQKYEAILGCSWDILRKWLELSFTNEMTWDNYGTVWHIDHTMPCSVFDFTVEENIKVCFNWSNLSPMNGIENISKSNKINMALVNTQKEKARTFITTHYNEILTESLPEDLRQYSGVLSTKVSVKADTGSGEISEVR